MNSILNQTLMLKGPFIMLTRSICCSAQLATKEWRMKQGLPINRNAYGPLTDGPDFTYLDGRPTPLLHKQKCRMMKQRGYAEKIVELNEELDFAIERERKIKESLEEEKQMFLKNRLKPKGINLLKKS